MSVMLDSRIASLNPPLAADCIVPVVSSLEVQANIRVLSEQVDAVYVVAPETDGVLKSLVERVEQTGAASLNCKAIGIEKTSDKASFTEFMRTFGFRMPETQLFSVTDDLDEITRTVRDLSFPLIFKPSDGTSCGGVSVVRNEAQVQGAVAKIKGESQNKYFLVQEVVEGSAVSVSLLSTGSSVVSMSLNYQDVKLETPDMSSSYGGGVVPFNHPRGAEALDAAEKLVKSIPSLKGYVGVDFVLTDDEAVAIEVNARLTTSYVGLRRVVNFNPAQALVDAALKHELPAQIESCGYTYFSKVETPIPSETALQETYRMDDVVSPPFPVSANGTASALIASYGGSVQEATLRFSEAKKRVLDTISRGG